MKQLVVKTEVGILKAKRGIADAIKKIPQKHKEMGVNALVIEIGLVIVGIALLVVFNKEIAKLFTDIMADASAKIKEILGSNDGYTPA